MHICTQAHRYTGRKDIKNRHTPKGLQPFNTTHRNKGTGAYKHTATHPHKYTTMQARQQEPSQHTDTLSSEAQSYKYTDAQSAQPVCRNTAKVADGYMHTDIGYKHARKQARRNAGTHSNTKNNGKSTRVYKYMRTSSTHADRKLTASFIFLNALPSKQADRYTSETTKEALANKFLRTLTQTSRNTGKW